MFSTCKYNPCEATKDSLKDAREQFQKKVEGWLGTGLNMQYSWVLGFIGFKTWRRIGNTRVKVVYHCQGQNGVQRQGRKLLNY